MPDGSKGFSLLISITAQGFQPIQLGLGFRLSGIGGLIGVNRTVAVDVLRAGLKKGSLDAVLFPDDPVRNAAQIVTSIRKVFPPADGRFVFGPMVVIDWGTPPVVTMDLGRDPGGAVAGAPDRARPDSRGAAARRQGRSSS